jgi:hypothetical protein
MKGLPFVLLFTAMTFLAWGAYGPVLHHGTLALDKDSLRAFVGVGLAYFLIAVLIPIVILRSSKEVGKWTVSGIIYSLIAGSVGALGALGIILALGYGGETVYVMPLVFGFAPVVNTLVTAAISKTFGDIRPIFIAGIVTAALGAVGVLTFRAPVSAPAEKPQITQAVFHLPAPVLNDSEIQPPSDETPAPEPPPAKEPATEPVVEPAPKSEPPVSVEASASPSNESATAAPEQPQTASNPQDEATKQTQEDSSSVKAVESAKTNDSAKAKNIAGIVFSIILAALCWGSYGPMLHIGQGKMAGSRLRPFMCVGIAYFLIAVLVPLFLIYSRAKDSGSWTADGMTWAFFAGVAGAIGALGVILAFNAGGKPYYVMPLIFGFAPVINTFISLSEKGTWHLVHPLFWVSLLVVIAGAVTVLITAPKPKPKPAT